jgi:catechol 2,3-dioxygenase-like lactoylglutathione lyase family enzyme
MVGYTTLGTNDLERAAGFYDALLSEHGGKRVMENERMVMWGGGGGGMLAICKPWDGAAASVGNGAMVAFALPSQDAVKSFHAKALSLGATDEGAPGPRGDGGFYGAYVRDLDGNKLCGFKIGG